MRYQWPRGLRRGSAVARLQGMRVWIPPGGGGCECECCVLSGRGFCDGLITRPEDSHRERCVWVWSWSLDNEALAHWGCCVLGGKKTISSFIVLPCWCKIYGLRKVMGPKIKVALITHHTPDFIKWHFIWRTPIPDILTVHVSTGIKATFMAKHTCGIEFSNISSLEGNSQNSILPHDLVR